MRTLPPETRMEMFRVRDAVPEGTGEESVMVSDVEPGPVGVTASVSVLSVAVATAAFGALVMARGSVPPASLHNTEPPVALRVTLGAGSEKLIVVIVPPPGPEGDSSSFLHVVRSALMQTTMRSDQKSRNMNLRFIVIPKDCE
jgi:hypothetical protein